MDVSQKILSDIIVWMKYAKFIPKKERRETWEEVVDRNMNMHISKYPNLEEEIRNCYNNFVLTKKVLPSMRSMQFAGKPIELNPSRIFNCSFLPMKDKEAFQEIMFLLLSGVGVGFSVQKHHVEQLPDIIKPRKDRTKRWLIGDSIEGWADSIKVLMNSYFKGGPKIRFDFNDIRPKGTRLITAGGKAPGPAPLRECLAKIEGILEHKEDGDKLKSIEVHDIVCHIADAVLSGGIRRAALLSLFSADDEEMISAKSGSWWELNPQRGRSNNSAAFLRHRITKDFFDKFWKRIELSNSGEPGIYFTNDKEMGVNPCGEAAVYLQFCNLTEINSDTIESQEDFNDRATAASFIGTLQAGYTDFHYLRSIWKKNTDKDALLGISLTGIASGAPLKFNSIEAASAAARENERVSKLIGINKASRLTVIKPSGTASLVLGTSSGIHAWHNDFYLRRIRVNKNEAIYTYLQVNHPELIEDEYFSPHSTAVISIPQRAPKNAILRSESPFELLERVKRIYNEWILPGHRKGPNTHNVSATISIREGEWAAVGEWVWENRNQFTGLSFLPYDGGSYIQAPFQDITKEEFEKLESVLHELDVTKIIEMDDNTDLSGELACFGGQCEIR